MCVSVAVGSEDGLCGVAVGVAVAGRPERGQGPPPVTEESSAPHAAAAGRQPRRECCGAGTVM